jgi:hypothetical protein
MKIERKIELNIILQNIDEIRSLLYAMQYVDTDLNNGNIPEDKAEEIQETISELLETLSFYERNL